jgi:hypothetical protein
MMQLLVTDSCAELVGKNSTFRDILWNLHRLRDAKKRLTLMDNPHFYAKLPEPQEEYESRIEIDPTVATEDLWQADKFYILTDRQELVYIMTDQVTLTFGNFWRSENALIFKGLSIFVVLLPLFLMSCQTCVGDSREAQSSRHLS